MLTNLYIRHVVCISMLAYKIILTEHLFLNLKCTQIQKGKQKLVPIFHGIETNEPTTYF